MEFLPMAGSETLRTFTVCAQGNIIMLDLCILDLCRKQ